MVWEHVAAFEMLLREVELAQKARHDRASRRKAAICLHLAVLAVETFVNVYFRLLVAERQYAPHKEWILSDIAARKGIEYKLKQWPKALFGGEWDTAQGIGQRFEDMRKARNNLMHYRYEPQKVHILGTAVHGLTNISPYHGLGAAQAREFFTTMRDTIAELLRLSGKNEQEVPNALHAWTGLVTW